MTTEEDPKKRKVGRKITRKNIEIRKKRSKWEWELDFKHNYKDECGEKIETIKLQRAYGECLGTKRRRRTWPTAKSYGEL